MLIDIKKRIVEKDNNENEKVVYVIGECEYDFTFENLNSLIDLIIAETDEIIVECKDENYKNYEKLLESIIQEVKNEDFTNLVKTLESDLTNDEIIAILSPNNIKS